jgi:hypothetical protein
MKWVDKLEIPPSNVNPILVEHVFVVIPCRDPIKEGPEWGNVEGKDFEQEGVSFGSRESLCCHIIASPSLWNLTCFMAGVVIGSIAVVGVGLAFAFLFAFQFALILETFLFPCRAKYL